MQSATLTSRSAQCRVVAKPSSSRKRLAVVAAVCRDGTSTSQPEASRRAILAGTAAIVAAGVAPALPAGAVISKQELALRRRKIPEEEFTVGQQGIKYYDIIPGGGAEARIGERVAVHYDLKWRNITFMTSRQGMGVTGGTPLGFDVGTPAGEPGGTLAGLDVGVRGMRVGGLRRVLVPPELGYGNVQVGEIPPGSTLQLDIELLSIKTNPFGYRTKLVEG